MGYRQVQSGNYGSVTYHGLNETVMELLDRWLWPEVAAFYDKNTGDVRDGAGNLANVTSDGVVKMEYEIAPGSKGRR